MSRCDSTSAQSVAEWQSRFTTFVPRIKRIANRAFRNCATELREELIAEVVADAFIWYRRLVERGRERDAPPTVLAAFSVKRVGSGLQLGNRRNKHNISSRYAQLRTGVLVQLLQSFGRGTGDLSEILVAYRQASPVELAASSIDVPHWLSTLTLRDRAIALSFAAAKRSGRWPQCSIRRAEEFRSCVANLRQVGLRCTAWTRVVASSAQLRVELLRCARHAFSVTTVSYLIESSMDAMYNRFNRQEGQRAPLRYIWNALTAWLDWAPCGNEPQRTLSSMAAPWGF